MKKTLSALGVIFVVLFVLALVCVMLGKIGGSTEEPSAPTAAPTVEATASPAAEPTAAPTATPTAEPTAEPTEEPTPEQGTSAMVDHLTRTAKNAAGGPDAEEKAAAAYDWIVENVPQWYDGPEMMERAIYNGALVEYYYTGKDDTRSGVGADTVQSVKYVYRGIETVLDEATRENIQQIKEGIEKGRGN